MNLEPMAYALAVLLTDRHAGDTIEDLEVAKLFKMK